MTKTEFKQRFPFQQTNHEKRDVLLCFHHAGGSALIFKGWTALGLPFEIVPVEIPGRGTRCREDCLIAFDQVVQDAADSIREVYDGRQLFLFGHSLGSVIAFETAVRLQNHGMKVKKLFAAGRVSPDQPERSEYRCSMGMDSLKKELARIGATTEEVLMDEGFNDYLLPIIFADYKLVEDYRYRGDKLDCPVVALSGSKDPDADEHMMKSWENVTDSWFRQYQFQGSHFFPYEAEEERLLKVIRREILLDETEGNQ